MKVTSASISFAQNLHIIFKNWQLRAEVTEEKTAFGKLIYRIWMKGKDELPKLATIIYAHINDNYVYHKKEYMTQRLKE